MSRESVATGEGGEQAAGVGDTRLSSVGYWLWRWRWPLLFALLLSVFCEAAWLTFLTPGEADLAHYECYGLTFWLGSHGASLLPQNYCSFLHITTPQMPWRLLPQEYPPLTILLFSLPLLAPLPDYAFAFALLMTLCAALIYWLLARSDARRAAPVFVLYLLLGAAGVFQERFDLVPAACTLLCLLSAERGRWRLAYFALALGVLFKLYPIVMLPALFLAEQRAWLANIDISSGENLLAGSKEDGRGSGLQAEDQRTIWNLITHLKWGNALLFVGLLVLVMGVFALLNFSDAILSPLAYFLNRPPQIESLLGSLIWLGGLTRVPYHISFGNGSLNISSALTRFLSPVDTLFTLLGILALFWLQWRKRLDLAQALVGLVCVLIVTGKVFSPQYLIWLIPLLAYMSARGGTNRLWMLLWAVIALLTTFIYVFYYSRLPDPSQASLVVQTLPGFFVCVALRNLLLLISSLAFLGGWWGVRRNAQCTPQKH